MIISKLNPKLTPADQFDIIKVSTDSVFPLPLGNISPNMKKKEGGLVSIINNNNVIVSYCVVHYTQPLEENQKLMNQALKEVNNLAVTLLTKEFSSDNLESIFKVLYSVMGSM